MITVPAEFAAPDKIAEAVGRPSGELNMSFTDMAIDKASLTLNVTVKLNFVVPLNIEDDIRRRMLSKFDMLEGVNFSYIYENDEPAQKPQQEKVAKDANPGDFYRKKKYAEVAAGEVILGKPITREAMTITQAYETTGTKGEKSVEGTVFSSELTVTKNGFNILKILIHDCHRAMCVKTFLKEEDVESVTEKLKNGDRIRVQGHTEYDTFEEEMVFRCNAINRLEKIKKPDNHIGPKRVELHAHTKMSDSDGFNEIEDLITQAAEWGQPAVAITDHGVAQAFPPAMKCRQALAKKGMDIKILYGIEGYLYNDEGCYNADGSLDYKKHGTFHIIILARNQQGIHDLYELVSLSHINYYYKRPRIPRSLLMKFKDNLVIGSACEAGEIYRAIRSNAERDELERIAALYDYFEIQPLGNNRFLIDKGFVESEQDLIDINMRIVELADSLGKPVVATTDSHYPTPESAIFRNIIMAGMGFTETASNSLYLRTTDEMLSEFTYLGERAAEIVIANTNKIADMIDDDITPISPEKCPPILEGSDEKLRSVCYERAESIYGNPLPEPVADRLKIELDSIINNGYAVMYMAAQMLVHKSMSDGYLVGSRGSVGSSFVATMAGITEVNPLAPHYICPECKHFEFSDEPEKYDVGFDMPDKACPVCGAGMNKDGLNIPFATFLGFKGDKEPDIDLNFAGEYQSSAHRYVSEIFGEHNTIFKAGTVSKIENRTAYGHVLHFINETGYQANKFDIDYLAAGCSGVKRTTGQHPGGMIIVPEGHDIYDFCPVQRPANKQNIDVITTHFEYHSIEHNLLKLDILGHTVPQMIRHLQVMTGVEPMTIPLDDKETISIFTKLDALKITNPNYRFKHGTYGIPEFGTVATRLMLDDIMPTTMSMLIKISGFAHGTNVWANNVQTLLRDGVATMDEVISSRDDIMNYLISKGVENSMSFKIMENVRKNRPLTEEQLTTMAEHGVPDWYVWSCNTLTYLFPRAHASAYVIMAFRMAWFKVNYPAAFYASWLSSKIDDFNIECALGGIEKVEEMMDEINGLGMKASDKQDNQLTVLEVVYEMYSRGVEFALPKLGASLATSFTVVDGKVQIPFQGVPGVGGMAAASLAEAYERKPFASLDDVRKNTKLAASNIDECKKYGLFADLPDSAQVTLSFEDLF